MKRSELLKLTACPSCRSSLTSFSACGRCGTEFSAIDDTPALFPSQENARRQVTIEYDHGRSIATKGFEKCFKFPTRRGRAARDLPYHLDLAHHDAFASLPPASLVLELGCGGAQMRPYIESMNLRYVGTDLSKERFHAHLRRGEPDLLCDSHFLPFRDESFDVVYSAAVTQYFAFPQLVAQETRRVLKPGGLCLGNVAFLEPWVDGSFFHMTPLAVHEVLTQAGFEIECIWPGEDWNAFRALLTMSSRAMRPFAILGDVAHAAYRGVHWIGDRLKGRPRAATINRTARIAGAIAWIARRPTAARRAEANAADPARSQAECV